jgi:hypothetical protein
MRNLLNDSKNAEARYQELAEKAGKPTGNKNWKAFLKQIRDTFIHGAALWLRLK